MTKIKSTRLLFSFFLLLTLIKPVYSSESYITLASTTSTQASGFFDYYLPIFKKKTGIDVRVIAVGTGQALKLAENGDADILLVHDKAGELKFIEQGFGIDRREVMYNDFVFIGPASDPAGISCLRDSIKALQLIAESKSEFISRGDDSGTHRLELRLWKQAGINPQATGINWYKEAGAGMGTVLNMLAGKEQAYSISDRATWIAFKNREDLELLVEGDPLLFNQYSLILVNPDKHPHVKKEDALKFMDWMTSAEGQNMIEAFKVNEQILFRPNAQKNNL